MPKISVVMGIYNSNKKDMVQAAIDSILNQSYPDFEFIICDDGSRDGTFDLLKRIAKKDKRILLLQNAENEGLAITLNKCLERAEGEFIARMDADDLSLPQRFEKQIQFMEDNPDCAMVGSNAILFDEHGDWGFRRKDREPDKKSFLFNNPFIHPSLIIRKEVLQELDGYRTDKEAVRCEDYDLFMRLYGKGLKGCNLQEPLLKFREDANTYKRRKFRYRINEAKVRCRGFRRLGLMPAGFVFVIKPLLMGLISPTTLAKLRRENVKS